MGGSVQFGYARVSTLDQDTALQLAAFSAAGVDRIFEEKLSGVARRPVLERVLYSLRAGDVLVARPVFQSLRR